MKRMNGTERRKNSSRGMLAVPHTGTFNWMAVSSLMTLDLPKGTSFEPHGFSVVHEARGRLCQQMMDEERDWILMVDSDMIITSDTIKRLLSRDAPIVGGLAFKRSPPYQCAAYGEVRKRDDGSWYFGAAEEWIEGLIQVAGIGTAGMLIRREALEQIPKPWFYPFPGLGEDLSFCLRATEAGVPVYLDTTVKTHHLTTAAIGEEHFRHHRAQKAGAL